jgi:hypothetical protein
MAGVHGGFEKGECSKVPEDAALTAEELERKQSRKKEIERIRSAESRAESLLNMLSSACSIVMLLLLEQPTTLANYKMHFVTNDY